MNKKLIYIISPIILLAVAYFGGSWWMNQQKQQEIQKQASANQTRLVPFDAIFEGPADAQVTVVEFFDPECETCRVFYPYVKELLKRFEGKVKVVHRYLPLHHNSKFAVGVLEASRKQGKYWEALERLFHYQPQWGSHHNPNPEFIWTILPEAGVDVAQAKKDLADPAFTASVEKLIERDMADAQALGAKYTPSFFIGGEPLVDFGVQQLFDAVESKL